MGEARSRIFIEAPLKEVNAYARDPRKWQEWFINFHGPDKMTGEGGAGTIIEARYSIMGKKFSNTIEIMEDRSDFWRGKISGVMEGELRVSKLQKDGGTEVTMEWNYTLSMGKIGKIADSLAIEKMISHALENSTENLKTICESASHLVSH